MVYFYYLTSPHTEIRYIGKTSRSLKKRLQGHKSDFRSDKRKNCGSEKLLELGEDDVEINLIIDKPEWTYEQVEAKEYEQKLIEESPFELCNRRRAYLNPELKKKLCREYSKQYKKNNRDKVNAYKRDYYHSGAGKEQLLKYKENNPEKVKEWRETSKNKKYTCEICSKVMSWNKRKRHMEFHNDVKVKCPHCEKMLRKGSVRRHVQRIHEGVKIVAPKTKAKCPHCDKEMLKKSINRHVRRYHMD